jgi:hypothetical protein
MASLAELEALIVGGTASIQSRATSSPTSWPPSDVACQLPPVSVSARWSLVAWYFRPRYSENDFLEHLFILVPVRSRRSGR